LAHNPQGLAPVDGEGHAVHGPDHAPGGAEGGAQVLHVEEELSFGTLQGKAFDAAPQPAPLHGLGYGRHPGSLEALPDGPPPPRRRFLGPGPRTVLTGLVGEPAGGLAVAHRSRPAQRAPSLTSKWA